MNLDPEILEVIYTNEGEDLMSLSHQQPVLLVFLRHFGCIFCKETLSDMALLRNAIESRGLKVVMVHMADEEKAEAFFDRYKIPGVAHISDPDLSLYEYFGLSRGNFSQLFGLKVWRRGFQTGVLDGHGLPYSAKGLGKADQMPGVFIVNKGDVKERFIHNSAADRPNYIELVDSYISSHTQGNNQEVSTA